MFGRSAAEATREVMIEKGAAAAAACRIRRRLTRAVEDFLVVISGISIPRLESEYQAIIYNPYP
jgi:hypothetical protein